MKLEKQKLFPVPKGYLYPFHNETISVYSLNDLMTYYDLVIVEVQPSTVYEGYDKVVIDKRDFIVLKEQPHDYKKETYLKDEIFYNLMQLLEMYK